MNGIDSKTEGHKSERGTHHFSFGSSKSLRSFFTSVSLQTSDQHTGLFTDGADVYRGSGVLSRTVFI